MTIRTFGCSLTYGHGLPDCMAPGLAKNPKASKMAWPKVLEELLDMKVVNHSKYGSSIKRNAYVATELISWEVGDTAIFLWPHKVRSAVIMSASSITDLGPWGDSEEVRQYYKGPGMSDLDIEHDAIIRIIVTDRMLREQGVKVFHLLNIMDLDKSAGSKLILTDWLDNIPDRDDPDFCINTIAKRIKSKGGDYHPGVSAHRNYAKILYKKIRNQL